MATVVAKGIRALSTTYRKFRRANSFESPDIVTVHCKFRRTNLFDSSDVTKLERGESRSKSIRGKAGKACLGFVTGIVGGCGAILYFLDRSVKAYASTIALPRYPWEFNRTLKSFDHAALRRGWQVYRTVCYTCHSLKYVCFLDLVEVTHSREEVKAIAAEFEVDDGPNEQGDYYKRPAKLNDRVPPPFPNEEAARAANFGAYPPDLSQIIHSRKRGTDYMFSLLTGWIDPPAGIHLADGQYFNTYFPGGITTMAEMFFDGLVEYDDGVPATKSQMAKDVVEFLSWSASPEHDTRKMLFLKGTGIFLVLLITIAHIHRRNISHFRSRQIIYIPKRTH
ncbi:uncharacterized protein LOC143147685 [Ptiloglossa arizonensis]|uniref:uncharacterized protein LOC143147685 n=1 Tax=Ptiloglossa arizonensis TaxID=3350558 RepID=UPI003FA16FEB